MRKWKPEPFWVPYRTHWTRHYFRDPTWLIGGKSLCERSYRHLACPTTEWSNSFSGWGHPSMTARAYKGLPIRKCKACERMLKKKEA